MSKTIDKFGRKRKWGGNVIRGPPGNGFKLTKDGHYDMQRKILKNTSEPIDKSDCVTVSYLEGEINGAKEVILLALQAAIQSTIGNIARDARQAFDDKIAEARITFTRKFDKLTSDVDIKMSDITASTNKKFDAMSNITGTTMKKYDVLEQRVEVLEKNHKEVLERNYKVRPSSSGGLGYPGLNINPNHRIIQPKPKPTDDVLMEPTW